MSTSYQLPELPGVPLEIVTSAVSKGLVKGRNVFHLNNFLTHFQDAILDDRELSEAEVKAYVFDKLGYKPTTVTGYSRLNAIMNAYRIFYENGPFLSSFVRGIASVYREYKPPKLERKKSKSVIAAPIEAVPAPLRTALEEMRQGYEGIYRSAPSREFIVSIDQRVRQLVRACMDHDVQPMLNIACITIYEKSLLSREKPLRRTTIRSSLNAIRDVARYVGSDLDVIQHLENRVRYHEKKAANDMPLKELNIQKIPSYTKIFEQAFDLLDQSNTARHIAKGQKLRNYACAVVLLLPCPLRVGDSELIFGENVNWTGSTWRIDVPETSKTGDAFGAVLLPLFRVFIDELVLQGADEVYLDELRSAVVDKRRALFEDHLGRPIGKPYVSTAWRRVFGTGSHIARTKIHDEFARLGPAGVEAALVACGHRSHKSAEHYRTRAFHLLAGEHIKTTASNDIYDFEWKEHFRMDA